MSLFEELKRRNVVRMGMLYVVASWLILQVADVLFEALELPPSATRLVLGILLLGFPLVLIVSWVYEMTPEGLKRESEVRRDESITHETGRKMNTLIIGLLIVAIGMVVVDRLVPEAPVVTPGGEGVVGNVVEERSIAVLPFANRSAQQDDVYFVDGMHDDILTQLARIDSLIVTSRTSVEQYRGTTLSIPEIAAQLGVRNILEGGVQRAGNRVRINMQLISAEGDDHLWAETFERELTASNLFEVQGEIAKAVTSALQVALNSDEEAALAERPTDSIAAYDLYLLGRFHQKNRDEDSLLLAKDYFERATKEDPEFVLALSGLSDSYVLLATYGNLGGGEVYPLAEQAIDSAMALDDEVSEVWSSLGILRRNQGRHDEAEQALARAIELDEKNFNAWNWYGLTLANLRRFAEGIAAFEKAYALEPMSVPVNTNLANYSIWRGDFPLGRQHLRRLVQIDEERADDYVREIANSYLQEGKLARAVEGLHEILSATPDNAPALSGLAYSHVLMGNEAEAAGWYSRASSVNPFASGVIVLYQAQGDFEAATLLLEDILQRFGNRRVVPVLLELFRLSYTDGDIESASGYLKEALGYLNGRIEVEPGLINQLDALLAAEFLILHGEASGLDPARGQEMLAEAHTGLLEMRSQAYAHPLTLASVAVAEAMLGNPVPATDSLSAAVEGGLRDLSRVFAFTSFDSLAGTPELQAVSARVKTLIDAEVTQLSSIELAVIPDETERQPLAISREKLGDYEGYYTDNNVLAHLRVKSDGAFVMTAGQQFPDVPLFAYADDRFFSSMDKGSDFLFERDESGKITHFMMTFFGSTQRMKVTSPPPASVMLSRELLESYQGTYAWARPSADPESAAEVDYWVAVVALEEDGALWVDFDNQPKLVTSAFSETEFIMPGFIGDMEFYFEDGKQEPAGFTFDKDGTILDFVRR